MIRKATIRGTPSPGSGWAAMARTIRELDGEKIRDCKEDIDTLLVFAGLFSAVLTAFLIESYRNLQPDANAPVVQLLQDISAHTRGYTVSNGFMNATAAPTSDIPEPSSDSTTGTPPPFTAPLLAVRINALWFASLIFSLATASFGMLVKQWLREYLSGSHTSPQARLRVRHFRAPGLRTWKVFEIAALLPLLLQLSLGLFFSGLCLFTLSIHRAVGYTSVPLVGGWAFFLSLSLVAPIFFPRCPYKTNLFSRGIASLRSLRLQLQCRFGDWLLERRAALKESDGGLASGARWLLFSPLVEHLARPDLHIDEAVVARDETRDMDVLAGLDATLMDDELFGSTIWQAVQQVQSGPDAILEFLLSALRRRLHTNIPESFPIMRLLNLRPLQREGWRAAMDIAASVLMYGLESRPGGSEWEPYMREAFCLLLSYSDYSLPESGVRALAAVLTASDRTIASDFIEARFGTADSELYAHVLRRMRLSFKQLSPENAVPSVFLIGRCCICPPEENRHFHHNYVADFMWEHREFKCDTLWAAILAILADVVSGAPERWRPFVYESLRAVMSARIPDCAQADVYTMLSVLLRQGYTRYAMCRQVANLNIKKRAYGPEKGMETICAIYRESTDTMPHQILTGFIDVTTSYTKGEYKNERDFDPLDYVRLCLFFLTVYKAHSPEYGKCVPQKIDVRQDWEKLFAPNLMPAALKQFAAEDRKEVEDSELALQCLTLLNQFEADYKSPYVAQAEVRKQEGLVDSEQEQARERRNPFPDELFVNLAAFVKVEHIERRLKLSHVQARLELL